MKLIAKAGLAVLATVAALLGTPAQADDGYVCDGGRLVYARPETLQKLKQTDPCIAGYFPTKPKARPEQPAAAEGPAANANSARDPGPDGQAATPPLKRAIAPLKEASLPAHGAPSPVDFRNVRVINASPDQGAAIFRHVR